MLHGTSTLQFAIEFGISQSNQGPGAHAVRELPHCPINQNVVEVDEHELIEIFPESVVNEVLQ